MERQKGPKPRISLRELLTNKEARERLSVPQLLQLMERLREVSTQVVRTVAPPGTPADLATKYSRGKWQHAPHVDLISSRLVDLWRGERQRLMVSLPPRHGKSELISFWFPIWVLAQDPSKKIILASYEAEFAAQWGRRVRNALTEFGPELGIYLDNTSMAAHSWSTTAGGGMHTAGAGGPITGRGADVLIVDDAIKGVEDAQSETLRENLWNWWQTVAFTRLDTITAFPVIIGTRWHEDDLMGRLETQSRLTERDIEQGLEPRGLVWDVLKIPALAEANDPLGRPEGEPLWPERIPLKKLLDHRRGTSPYNWSCVYQQRPTPEEGGSIKRAWWRFYKQAPAFDQFDETIQSWDLPFKDLADSSYAVGQVWGRRGAEFFLLHQVRDHMNAPESLMAIKNFCALYPRAARKLIEDKANGPAVIALLSKEVYGIVPVKVKGSKDARLSGVAPLIEAGNVYLPDPERAPWVPELIEECAAFPNAAHDDQVDALSQALAYLMHGGYSSISAAHEHALNWQLPTTLVEAHTQQIHKELRKAVAKTATKINQQGRWQDLGHRALRW